MRLSILISSYNRIKLFRRALWSIANRPPSCDFEVIVVDDNSTEDTLGEIKKYSSRFPWKFIRFRPDLFEEATGLKKYFNNSSPTNNIAFKASSGELIAQQGNEIIAWSDVYDRLIEATPECPPAYIVFSTTYDVPQQILDLLDDYGTNFRQAYVHFCSQWPLQSKSYRSDVTNYISLTPRTVWEAIGGYDERYYAGISAEDSDFVRRARCLEGFKTIISDGVSLHQSHQGKTAYYNPPPSVITSEAWDEGVKINHAVYNSWDGTQHNRQPWPWGTFGAGEVFTNVLERDAILKEYLKNG